MHTGDGVFTTEQEAVEVEQEQVFLAFARKRQRRMLAMIIALAVVALITMFGMSRWSPVATAAAAGVTLGGLVFFVARDWRCPVCERPLSAEWHHTYCSRCGTRLTA